MRPSLNVVLLAVTLLHPLSAQDSPTSRAERVQWLQQHAAPIRSTDPADEDFSDLAPLGVAIGESQIVMLGEQSHGDGTTFLAKTRIIKYLHEKLGFDVLAFESGLYDMSKAWGFLERGEAADTAVPRGLFLIWAGSAQLQPLVAYVGQQAKSQRPLELAGFDNQFTASASRDFFGADLRTFLADHGIDTTSVHEWPDVAQMLDELTTFSWYALMPTKAQFGRYMTGWDELRARVDRLEAPDTAVPYWKQVLKSTGAYAVQQFSAGAADSNSQSPDSVMSIRDVQMGENLLWLARVKFPERKIIVWAATYHIIRNPEVINTGPTNPMNYENVVTMGHVVSGELRDKVYSIGFVASDGSAGTWMVPPEPIPTPPDTSLDAMLAATAHDNAFIDFRGLAESGEWLRKPLVSAPLGYASFTADWTHVLDGMIYTRHMTPSTRLHPVAEAPTYAAAERQAASCSIGPRIGCGLAADQFALIPGGSFEMGSDSGSSNEKPSHRVTMSRAFYMQKSELSQAQWLAVMGTNPSRFSSCGDTCPVDQVSWNDIQTFLLKVNASSLDATYRLPTEAEWEYAARAGTTGDTYGPLDSIAWHALNAAGKPHPVAGRQSNAWGLFDMLGNKWEWVNDRFGPYDSAATTDPVGPEEGVARVVRGGGLNEASLLRASFRSAGAPVLSGPALGFRLVRVPRLQAQ